MGSRSSPIIVGRERELGAIDRALAAAAEGRPVLLLVRGEAGIGKSRLVREAVERARAGGSAILHGTCLDLGDEGIPYLPIIEALRGLAGSTPRDRLSEVLGPARDELARLLPELAEGEGAAAGADDGSAGPDSGVDRARLFERFIGFLGRLGEKAPVVGVIEDVQWIDPATRDMLTFLVRNVTTQPIVAILTCRTDDLAPGHPVSTWMAELGRAPGGARIDLRRLSRADVASQLEAIAGGPVAQDVVDSIWRRSEGLPLFAEELFGSIDAPEDAPLPSLVDVLLGRVAALDPDTLAAVEALAIAARPVDERILGAVLERGEREIGVALREAAARGVLTTDADGRYGFRHELLRFVVERDVSPAERRDLHERFARQIEERPELAEGGRSGAAGELARHWAAAERPLEAYRSALAAASAAEGVNAFEEALRLRERAMTLEPALPPEAAPDVAARIDARRRAADDADLAGRFGRAIELATEALSLVDPAADPTSAAMLHSRLGYFTWASGNGEAALAEHREAVRLVPVDPPTTERARVLGAYGGALMGLGRWPESREICQAAVDCAMAAGARAEESRARNMLGSDLVAMGEIDAGLEELKRSRQLAEAGPPELLVVTSHNLALNLLAADRLDEALAAATGARDAARATGLDRRYGLDLAALAGDALYRLGRWDEADGMTSDGLALDQRGLGTTYLAAVRARLVAGRGDADEAARRIEAIDRASLAPDVAAFVAALDAEARLATGDAAGAVEAAEAGMTHLEGLDDVLWGSPLVGLGLRAIAELVEIARAGQDVPTRQAAERRGAALVAALDSLAERATTPSARAWAATARAERTRVEG
ncbi:MAG: ATP-binding protein, partial [Gaiellaceae bacterium]